ncbi:unnamed protein product [[Actinomadura] parvosata subsp. kistnae]|nr:unnamed protein product [Actinomadura parvosata subsp. kistnae]
MGALRGVGLGRPGRLADDPVRGAPVLQVLGVVLPLDLAASGCVGHG